MWKQSVWSSAIAATIAAKCLKVIIMSNRIQSLVQTRPLVLKFKTLLTYCAIRTYRIHTVSMSKHLSNLNH